MKGVVQVHPVAGNVGHFIDVTRAAERDVGLHALHPKALAFAEEPHLRLTRVPDQFAENPRVLGFNERIGPFPRGFLHEKTGQRTVIKVEAFDEERLTGFQACRVVDQNLGELFPARVGHVDGSRHGLQTSRRGISETPIMKFRQGLRLAPAGSLLTTPGTPAEESSRRDRDTAAGFTRGGSILQVHRHLADGPSKSERGRVGLVHR